MRSLREESGKRTAEGIEEEMMRLEEAWRDWGGGEKGTGRSVRGSEGVRVCTSTCSKPSQSPQSLSGQV